MHFMLIFLVCVEDGLKFVPRAEAIDDKFDYRFDLFLTVLWQNLRELSYFRFSF
jgi:hypothetical protein